MSVIFCLLRTYSCILLIFYRHQWTACVRAVNTVLLFDCASNSWKLWHQFHPTVPPHLWPSNPNSFDLNPADYNIWGTLQERVYMTKSRTSPSERIVDEWDKRIIDETIGEWRNRLRACVGKGQFEHQMIRHEHFWLLAFLPCRPITFKA